MDTPCILFNSCSDFPTDNIIKDILKVDKLPQGQKIIENVLGYDWHIETKYYSADVKLCVTQKRTIGDEAFAESVQAFVVYFDPDEEKTFQLVKSWGSYLDQIDPEIKMLVCDQCTEKHKINRLEAQTWCIDNGFELVELNADSPSDSENEDDFIETTGIKRIIQSLHAHTWPNLVLKDSRTTVSPYIRQLMQEEHDAKKLAKTDSDNMVVNDLNANDGTSEPDSAEHSTLADGCGDCDREETKEQSGASAGSVVSNGEHSDTSKNKGQKKKEEKPTKEERLDSLLPSDDQQLFEALGSEDPGGESFEKLFEKFANMKAKASSLPLEDRKKYAEKVAVAFWQAIGGDEDEIGDLDSDD